MSEFSTRRLEQGDILTNVKGLKWTVTSGWNARSGGVNVQSLSTGEKRTIFAEMLSIPWVCVDRPNVGRIYPCGEPPLIGIDEALTAMKDLETLIRRERINSVPVLQREWKEGLARAEEALPVIQKYITAKRKETN